ncbi:O-antigen polymerase [uncultured Thiobacillus sp.]|uniref:O-antigen polymerase n=1 Tax=uncultured Thiobacillus sp. TaxID=189996 RepID=UPI00262616EC|nr:O-antigen polymerase [uncultured Thiobacillus sp.]
MIAKQNRDMLAYPVIFVLLFIVSYPLKFILSYYGIAVMNPMVHDEDILNLTIIIFNLSAAAFLIPWFILKRCESPREMAINKKGTLKFNGIILLVFLGVILISISAGASAMKAVFSFSSEALANRIGERGLERTNSALAALLGLIGQIIMTLGVYRAAKQWDSLRKKEKSLLFAIACAGSIYLLALKGSKFIALNHFFSFFVFLNIENIRHRKYVFTLTHLVMGLIGGLFIVGVFGVIRGFGTASADSFVWGVFIQLSNAFDAPDNLSYILSRVKDLWFGDYSLSPTIQYLFAWVPRFLWPEKPLIYGNMFIQQEYLYERFTDETGEVVSPSMPGEMIVSGGVLFMLIWSLIIGLIYLFSYRKALASNNFIAPLVYAFLVTNVFGLLRSGTGVLGSLIFYLFGLFVVYYSIALIKGASRH